MVFKVAALLIFMCLLTIFAIQYPVATSETGPIEWTQNGMLVIALLAWLGVLIRLLRTGSGSFHYVFAAFFALLAYGVLGRELTWLEVLGADEYIADVIELCSIVLVMAAIMLLLYIWVVRVGDRKQALISWFKSSSFIYVLVALVFVLLGDAFDKKIFPVAEYRLYEEMSELTGYIFLLFAALCEWPFPSLRRKGH